MRTFRFVCLGVASFLATFNLAQPSHAQQFIAAKNVSPSTNVGGVYATGDINRDGKLDVIAVDVKKGSFVTLLGKGDGTFTEKIPSSPIPIQQANVQLGDFNGDGFLDLAMDYPGPTDIDGNGIAYGKLAVYLGDGTGDFHQTWSANIGAGDAELALGDVNGDGHLDVIATTDATYLGTGYVQVFFGDGRGSFQQHGGAGFQHLLAAGDFNEDGKTDLVVLQSKGISMLLSNGDGTFKAGESYDVLPGLFPTLVVADLNRDGHQDIAAVGGRGAPLSIGKTAILLGKGDGTFTIKSEFNNGFPNDPRQSNSIAIAAVAGDLNRDGIPDLVTYSELYSIEPGFDEPGIISVNYGRGDGTFTSATNYSATNPTNIGFVAAGDFNRDGNLDVVVGGFSSSYTSEIGIVQLLSGSPSGRLQAPINSLSSDPFSIVHADFNHDGIQDIAVVKQGCLNCSRTTVSVFLGTGKGYFSAPKNYTIRQDQGAISAGDINGDGKVDLVVTRTSVRSVSDGDISVLLGNGDGTFRPAVNSLLLGAVSGDSTPYLVDMNRDGKLDLVGDWGVALGNGDGTFRAPRRFFSDFPSGFANLNGLSIGDLNGDGIPDVVFYGGGYQGEGLIGTLLGDGTGSLTLKSMLSIPHESIRDLKIAKVYSGAELDLVFAGQAYDTVSRVTTGLVGTLKGKGDGTFSAQKITPLPNLPYTMNYGDFDRDGRLDVVLDDNELGTLSDGGQGVSYLRGKGDGTFYAPQSFPGRALYPQVMDVNGDGAPDVVGLSAIGFQRLLNTGRRY